MEEVNPGQVYNAQQALKPHHELPHVTQDSTKFEEAASIIENAADRKRKLMDPVDSCLKEAKIEATETKDAQDAIEDVPKGLSDEADTKKMEKVVKPEDPVELEDPTSVVPTPATTPDENQPEPKEEAVVNNDVETEKISRDVATPDESKGAEAEKADLQSELTDANIVVDISDI